MNENQLIGIYVKYVICKEPGLMFSQPLTEGYLVDKTTGNHIKADSSSTNLNEYISPVTLNKSEHCKRWYKLLVIDKNFSELNSEKNLLLFEFFKNVQQKNTKKLDQVRFAWAFLVPLASDGSFNTNQDLKLQLFKVPRDCKISHQDCHVFHLYSDHKFQKVHGYIEISVKGVVPSKTNTCQIQEKSQLLKESLPNDNKGEKQVIVENFSKSKSTLKSFPWSRLPTQSCKVPNKIHRTLIFGKKNVCCLRFSRSGFHIAFAVHSQIVIYEVESGNKTIELSYHRAFIYELNWSSDDKYLLSVGSDFLACVWDINQTSPAFILPHPQAGVFCGILLDDHKKIFTGGEDHLIRYWCKNSNDYDLKKEIYGHSGCITSLVIQDRSILISGDSQGTLMIRKFCEEDWVLVKQLSFSEISGSVVDSILTHTSRRRIIITVRCRNSYLVDIVSGIILQSYKTVGNPFARSVSCLTPCGSYLFSFYEGRGVGVWEVNTGKLFATYDNLFPNNFIPELSGYIHYHPHEHMVGIIALSQNYSLVILKYDATTDDSEKLGLSFVEKKTKS